MLIHLQKPGAPVVEALTHAGIGACAVDPSMPNFIHIPEHSLKEAGEILASGEWTSFLSTADRTLLCKNSSQEGSNSMFGHRTPNHALSHAVADPDNDDDQKSCPKCKHNDSDAEFCKYCGRKLHASTSDAVARIREQHAENMQRKSEALARSLRSTAREANCTVGDLLARMNMTSKDVAHLGMSKSELKRSEHSAPSGLAGVSPHVLRAAGLAGKSSQAVIDDGDGPEIGLPNRTEAKAIFEKSQRDLADAERGLDR
jgi:hypothetical protein